MIDKTEVKPNEANVIAIAKKDNQMCNLLIQSLFNG
jgi:hypothetical protein